MLKLSHVLAATLAAALPGSALAGGITLGPGVGAAPRVMTIPRAAMRPAMTQNVGGKQWRGHYGIPPQAPYDDGHYDTDRQRAFHRRGYFPNGFVGYGGYPYYGAVAASPAARSYVQNTPYPAYHAAPQQGEPGYTTRPLLLRSKAVFGEAASPKGSYGGPVIRSF